MVGKRSAIAGLLLGGIILSLGLALIGSKDWVWALFDALYSVLGVQAERRRLWEMFITTIGLGVSTTGFYIILLAWKRWREEQ
jgi:hypothetical protein